MISVLAHLVRLGRAGFVLAREGVFALIDPAMVPFPARIGLRVARLIERPTSERVEHRLASALTRLGPAYVKLGQFLATRPDVVGIALARDLESLQDRMEPFGQELAVAQIEAALGKPIGELFTQFGAPVAAASIAQVHRAEAATASGPRAVAVKVLRPDIARRFRVDLDAFAFAARNAESFSADARRLRLIEIVATLARSVVEMDMRLEAAAQSRWRRALRLIRIFAFPASIGPHGEGRATLEWIDGTPLSIAQGSSRKA